MLTALIVVALAAGADRGSEAAFVLPSGVKVRVVEAAFRTQDWKVEGCGPKDAVCRINGHVPFGSAFGTPRTYVRSITIEYEGRSHSLDVSDMYDAWGGRPLEHKGVVRYFGGKCSDTHNCQFRGLFSDGAGSFVAEWRIVQDHMVRTVLTDSSDVMNLFMDHIDPPEYE